MRKFTKVLAAALTAFLLLAPNPVLGQSSFYFWWQVVDELDRPFTGQTVKCSVYDLVSTHVSGQVSAKMLHSDANYINVGTTMPLTSDTNGRLHFYTSASTDVRANCFYAYGGQGQARLSRTTHKIIIPRGFGPKVARFQYVNNTAVTRTGLWLPAGTVIRDVLVYNGSKRQALATEAPPHINVGFLGDHSATFTEFNNHTNSALIHAMSLATDKEWIRPHVQLRFVSGGTPTGVVTSHRGVALARWHTTAGTLVGGIDIFGVASGGFYYEKDYVVDAPNGIEITYQTSSSAGLSGHVYLMFDLLHVSVFGSGVSN